MEKKVPGGRLGRMARLAALGLKTGAGAILSRGDDGGKAAADRAADVLGTMRGLAAKFGQMASYVDGIVPEGQRDAFEASLKMLRSQAPRSNPAQIRSVIESELGAPIDRLFASFEDEPLASASIGQVHRARLPEDVMGGIEVAVKVQHPGIRKRTYRPTYWPAHHLNLRPAIHGRGARANHRSWWRRVGRRSTTAARLEEVVPGDRSRRAVVGCDLCRHA